MLAIRWSCCWRSASRCFSRTTSARPPRCSRAGSSARRAPSASWPRRCSSGGAAPPSGRPGALTRGYRLTVFSRLADRMRAGARSPPRVSRCGVLDGRGSARRRRARARLGCRRRRLGARPTPRRARVIPARRSRSPRDPGHHSRSRAAPPERLRRPVPNRSSRRIGSWSRRSGNRMSSYQMQQGLTGTVNWQLIYDFASFQFSPTPTSTSSGTFKGTAPAIVRARARRRRPPDRPALRTAARRAP